jgi:threonylcarbamoyladenosine tRNA methylthiotransferase CDKAL1
MLLDCGVLLIRLLNSCTVKDPSQAAFMHLALKGKSQGKAVVVAGCVPQADRHLKGLEDVSIVGIQQVDRVVEVVEETLKGHAVRLLSKHRLPELDLPKIRKNPMVEIIPLSTGCLGACTYCKTRHARGKLGSYSPSAIVSRAQSVIDEGVTELWLSSEDTGAYGIDIGSDLPSLLRRVVDVMPSGVMMRVGMTNPPYILEHLDAVAEILNHDNVYAFLHVPVQSGSDDVLLGMNREYTVADFCQVADVLLEKVPGLTLATDIICGFPGETEEQFDETMALVEKYRFHIMNISQFYPRPGTPAAKMKRVPTQVVKNRSRRITKFFESLDPYSNIVGSIQKVWINTELSDDKRFTVGHTKNYTKVLLPRDDALIGCAAEVHIVSAARFHVNGEVVSRSEPATPAAAAIRHQIRTGGSVSPISSRSRKPRASAKKSSDTSSLSSCDGSGGCSSRGCDGDEHGHDHSHHHHDHDHHDSDGHSHSGGEGGCCGGSDGAGCCSSGGGGKCGGKCSSKKKKAKTSKTVIKKKQQRAADSSTSVIEVDHKAEVDEAVKSSWAADKWTQVKEDKVALVAFVTLVASTTLVAVRLLTRSK